MVLYLALSYALIVSENADFASELGSLVGFSTTLPHTSRASNHKSFSDYLVDVRMLV